MNSNIKSKLRWILVALFFFWALLVLSTYYNVQFSYLGRTLIRLGQQQWLAPVFSLRAFGNVLLDVLVAIWITLVALGTGLLPLGKLIPKELSPLNQGLFGLGIGFGLFGSVVLLIGLLGLLRTNIFLILMAILSVLTFRTVVGYLRRVRLPKIKAIILLFILLTLMLTLGLALLPPTDWDGLFYHLTGPQEYLQAGRIEANVDIPHLNFPSSFEMLFLLAMNLRGDVSAVLLHFVFALMLVGLVYSIARDLYRLTNPWLSVLFLLAMPMFTSLASWAYNDLALAFYEVGALYLLIIWHTKNHNKAQSNGDAENLDRVGGVSAVNRTSQVILGLSGLFAGFSMGLKYTSFVIPLTLAALIAWWMWRKPRDMFRSLLVFSAIAVMAAAPWYLKNIMFTSNPVYPFVFAGENWDDFRAAAYGRGGSGLAYNPEKCTAFDNDNLVSGMVPDCEIDLGYLAGNLVRLPYDMTLGLQDASGDGNTGPLILLFAPLILLFAVFRRGSERPLALNATLFFIATQFAFWTLGVVSTSVLFQTRLLLPAFISLCPILAWILEDLARYDHPKFSFKGQLIVIISLVLLAGLILQIINWLPYQPWAYLGGTEDREAYLERNLGSHYLALQAINEQLPDDSVVTLLWEPRSYYCQVECLPDSILDGFGHLNFLNGDAEGIYQALVNRGVSHVLIFEAGLDFVLNNNLWQEDALLEPADLTTMRLEYLEEIESFKVEHYNLFSLKPR